MVQSELQNSPENSRRESGAPFPDNENNQEDPNMLSEAGHQSFDVRGIKTRATSKALLGRQHTSRFVIESCPALLPVNVN